MKEYLGKKCKLQVNRRGEVLHFTANPVTDISDTHITFIDKFGSSRSFKILDIVEIYEEV